MASLKNASKSVQREHRERSQPASRAKLGALEKKKDYKARAQDYQRKQNTIKSLKRKALDKNPDEFYFKMVKTHKVDGVHEEKESAEPVCTEEQVKLMHSQDLRYVNYKRSTELKKIEKLKSSLHMIDAEEKPKNKHIIFVEKKKGEKFDAAKHFNTHPAFMKRTYNRPTLETLEKGTFNQHLDDETLEELAGERDKAYKQLTKRIHREQELNVIAQKLEMKKHLMDKKSKKKKVADETRTAPAQYRWCYQRKR